MRTTALSQHPDHQRRSTLPRRRSTAGFTLIELMITVAIIGVLAAIAYPSYNTAVLKGKRSEGRSALADLMQQQERYLTQTGCYGVQAAGLCTVIAAGATGVPFKTYSGNNPASASYLLGVRQCTFTPTPALTDCAEVYANPQFSDPKANVLWIRSTGEKGCSGTDPSTCWR